MISRLKGRSIQEIRERLTQLGRALAERRGLLPAVVIPADIALSPVTPWGACDPDAIRRHIPAEQRTALLARAEGVVRGSFDLLGLQGISYGSPVNWQRDPVSGREAPMLHWSQVPYLDDSRVGDHKIIWEVNRHQWFVLLGQAWLLTGEARFAEAASRLLREWLAANPPKRGINWCSALELAFRVQSWIHGLRLFEGAADFTDEFRRELVASAAMQVNHIGRNLSTWFSPNTHLTGEALALLSAGCAWPALPQAAHWRRLGWQILCEELPKQVRADGIYFEQSTWYQCYTLDFYLLALSWARNAGLPVPPSMLEYIRRMARALRAVTRPDGTIVRLGDDDGGHAAPFAMVAYGDMTGSLWRAAALLEDDALLPPTDSGRVTLLWLEGPRVYDQMATRTDGSAARVSGALRDGGWITLAERGETANRDHWLVFDTGPHGALASAHSHADALAIDLSVHGVPILVDPGTGAYVGERRQRFRSTSAHNTVTVDAADSSEQGSNFRWRSVADGRTEGFGVAAGASFAAASHDGYQRLADPVRHHRTILRLARRYWIMLDTLDANSDHSVSLTLQCAEGAHVAQLTSATFAVQVVDTRVQVALDPRMQAATESRTVSPVYAQERHAAAMVASARISAGVTFCSIIGADDEVGALSVLGESANVWRVLHHAGSDLIARPGGVTTTLGPAQFDGLALVVLDAVDPKTVVAAGAGTLHLAGNTFALGADEIRVAHRAANGTWTMES